MPAPICRNCGKDIPKRTAWHIFDQSRRAVDDYSTNHVEVPRNRAEVQRLVNGQVISVRYWGEGEKRYVTSAYVWDGESYIANDFCKDACARDFGRSVAQLKDGDGRPKYGMPAYWERLKEKT